MSVEPSTRNWERTLCALRATTLWRGEGAREAREPKGRRAVLGHPDWWKLNVLLYILRHPATAYPARELQAHLGRMGIKVTSRDIRRFCAHCGIRRDARAGRPRGSRTRQPMHRAA